jgi:hypothetical protein
MGYDIEQGDSRFTIRAEDSAAALLAVRALFSPDDISLGSGGMFVCGDPDSRVHAFAFVHTVRVHEALRLAEALAAWRWIPTLNGAGDIVAVAFRGSRRGDEAILFGALAPYVVASSVIEMSGEDGARWRWTFTDGALVTEWLDRTGVWVAGGLNGPFETAPGVEGGYLSPTPWCPGAAGESDTLR